MLTAVAEERRSIVETIPDPETIHERLDELRREQMLLRALLRAAEAKREQMNVRKKEESNGA